MELQFGEKLDLLIKRNNVKKGELAKAVGISPTYLSDVIKGKSIPSQKVKQGFLDYFYKDKDFLEGNVYRAAVKENTEIMNALPKDLREWVKNKNNANYIYLAKTIEENKVGKNEIMAIVEMLLNKKNQEEQQTNL